MSTVWKSQDGDICIMERPTSKFLYMHVKRPDTGKWIQKTSKRTSVEAAKEEAIKWLAVMSDRISRGVGATATPFNILCTKYLEEIDAEIAQHLATSGREGRNQKDLRDYKTIVRRYIQPYIGDSDIGSIGRIAVQDLIEKRRVYWVTGDGKDISEIQYERGGKTVKRPARHDLASVSALTKLGVILKRHFEIAVELKLLDEAAFPPIEVKKTSKAQRNRKGGKQPRSKFEVHQYRALLEFMPEWCLKSSRDTKLKRWSMHRLLLCDIIRFLAATGIRPGTESDFIQWKHIRAFDDKRGLDMSDPYTKRVHPDGERRILVQLPRGKTGARDAAGNTDALSPLLSIYTRYCDFHAGITERDDYVEGHLFGRDEQGLEPLAEFPELEMPDEMIAFSLPDGTPFKESSWRKTFNVLMRDFAAETEVGMTHDSQGRRLVPYSLRHSWISWQLQSGKLSIHQIAQQVGNTVAVIEASYAKTEVESFAHKHTALRELD